MRTPACVGMVEVAEGRRLAELAAGVPTGQAIVELGSHSGLSTCWMAHAARTSHVTAIDPWGDPRPDSDDDPLGLITGDATYERFAKNITAEGLWPRVTPLRTFSLEAARVWIQSVGLLFIDAVHEYDHVASDFLHWQRHLPVGSWVAFHDWTTDPEHHYYGVKLAIDDHVVRSGEWSEPVITQHLWTARRILAS